MLCRRGVALRRGIGDAPAAGRFGVSTCASIDPMLPINSKLVDKLLGTFGFSRFRGASPQGGFPSIFRCNAPRIPIQNGHLAGALYVGVGLCVTIRNDYVKDASLTLRILHPTAKSVRIWS